MYLVRIFRTKRCKNFKNITFKYKKLIFYNFYTINTPQKYGSRLRTIYY